MIKQLDLSAQLKVKLTLLVRSSDREHALSGLEKALESLCHDRYELQVVDVIKETIQARSFGAIHTPVVVRQLGNNKINYAGDFSNIERMRQVLCLLPELT